MSDAIKTPYQVSLEEDYEHQSVDVNEWLKQTRATAFERFHELDFPTKKDEAWKYANLNPLLKTSFSTATKKEQIEIEPQAIESHFLTKGSHRLTFINGISSPQFSSADNLPEGVKLQSLAEALVEQPEWVQAELKSGLKEELNPFASINTFSFQEGVCLTIADDVVVDLPIHLLFAGVGKDQSLANYPRVILSIGNGAKVNLLFDSIGITASSRFSNSLLDLHLGRNSRLDFVLLQREEAKAFQFFTTRARLQEGATLDYVGYSRGGEILRNEAVIDFEGENAFADLRFLSVLSEKTKFYNHIVMNHKVPGCTSRQLSKNILADKAQTEFNSLVSVFRDAQKSDTDQLNRNLLLSDSARAYSRPQLKIDADDVQCAHGAATGHLVGDELFYLRSRGIDKKLASFLLTYSFADEVLNSIPFPELRYFLENEVHHELDSILEKVQPENIGVV